MTDIVAWNLLIRREAFYSVHFLCSNYVFNLPTKCTYSCVYICVHNYLSNLSHMFRRIPHHPQEELFVPCSKLYAYCNIVTLVTKRTIYHMWVLQLYILLLEQHLALCFVLKLV